MRLEPVGLAPMTRSAVCHNFTESLYRDIIVLDAKCKWNLYKSKVKLGRLGAKTVVTVN